MNAKTETSLNARRLERDRAELIEALQTLAALVEAEDRGDDEAVPESLRNPSPDRLRDATGAACALLARMRTEEQ